MEIWLVYLEGTKCLEDVLFPFFESGENLSFKNVSCPVRWGKIQLAGMMKNQPSRPCNLRKWSSQYYLDVPLEVRITG